MTAYDHVPYPSHPHPQTHPDRLGTIAALFGLETAPPNHCRVLEIGCGNGNNLAPLAWSFPESQFLGIDLAEGPIARGQVMIEALRLKNVRLQQADLVDLRPGWEQFDYIIAHGFYSWVPGHVRDHLLALCQSSLARHGVAFISYNAYPGCHLRNMIREMMRFHVQRVEDPRERIEQAMAIMKFLAGAQDVQDPYRRWMGAELQQALEHSPGHLFHDDLAEINQPVYFTQFMMEARQHQLQYLGEADFFEMSDHLFNPDVHAKLQQLAKSRILREQYLDFLKCRRFRQTLLCHGDQRLADAPVAETVASFVVSSTAQARTLPVDLRPGETVIFEVPNGAKVETDYCIGKAALTLLGERGAAGYAFPDLLAEATQCLEQAGLSGQGGASEKEGLCAFLLRLYSVGALEFRTLSIPCAIAPSEKPTASPIAQWQITQGDTVTSLFHVAVQVEDEVSRYLLSLLDGTLSRSELTERLWQFLLGRGALSETTDKIEAKHLLAAQLEENLVKIARLGLLTR